jgi:hypothetical protein
MGYEIAHRIYLAQYNEEWQVLLNAVMGCQFLYKAGDFLSTSSSQKGLEV